MSKQSPWWGWEIQDDFTPRHAALTASCLHICHHPHQDFVTITITNALLSSFTSVETNPPSLGTRHLQDQAYAHCKLAG